MTSAACLLSGEVPCVLRLSLKQTEQGTGRNSKALRRGASKLPEVFHVPCSVGYQGRLNTLRTSLPVIHSVPNSSSTCLHFALSPCGKENSHIRAHKTEVSLVMRRPRLSMSACCGSVRLLVHSRLVFLMNARTCYALLVPLQLKHIDRVIANVNETLTFRYP